MAINYKLKVFEVINYKKIKEELIKCEIFKSKRLNTKYINKWVNKLEKLDNVNQLKMRNEGYIKKFYSNLTSQSSYEIFRYEYFFKFKITLPINFLIYPIKDFIIKFKVAPFSIEIEKLKKLKVFYSNENIDLYHFDIIEPIYILEFNTGDAKAVVIDGNHRISYALAKEIKNIDFYDIIQFSEKELNFFPTDYDKFCYIFINEINTIVMNKNLKNLNDRELKKISILF